MYTIRVDSLHDSKGLEYVYTLKRVLDHQIATSRFTARIEVIGSHKHTDIVMKPIRLKEKKLYCGQHPGECQATGRKQRASRCLEWDDWVEFHGLVNDVLDKLKVSADVWSKPPEKLSQGTKMWIRKGLRRRVHYSWESDWQSNDFGGREVRVWNHGTDDQFAKELAE